MDKLTAYNVFVTLAKTKSFSETAKKLYMSQPNVTRIICNLEKTLKVQCFWRSTRSVQLTDVGQRFYQHAVNVVEELNQFHHSLIDPSKELSGTINITVTIFLPNIFYGVIGGFLKKYPNLFINIESTNQYTNLIEQGKDVAIHIGLAPKSHQRISQQIGCRQMVFVAAPSYLNRCGVPKHPNDLIDHNCLLFSPIEKQAWIYLEHGVHQFVHVDGNLRCSSMTPIVDCLKNGTGIAYLPYYYVEKDVISGDVLEILKDYRPAIESIFVSHCFSSFVPAKILGFIHFLKGNMPSHFEEAT